MTPFTKVILETGPDGRARFREESIALSEGTPQAMLSPLMASGGYQLRHSPMGFRSQFHCTTSPQWVFILSGAMEIGLQDGSSRLFKPGDKSTVEDHIPPDAQAYFMRDPQWCLAQATTVGPACLAVVESLFAHRVLDHLRAAQGLLRLSDQYGRGRLDAACSRALNFGTPAYRTIKQILKEGLDQQPDLLESLPLEAPYLGGGRFSRNLADLLH